MTNAKNLFPRQTFVGFEHLLNELDFIGRHANDNYPPHNIVKLKEHNYLIEVACSGFSREEIEIEQNERTLTLTGKKEKHEQQLESGMHNKVNIDFLKNQVEQLRADVEKLKDKVRENGNH